MWMPPRSKRTCPSDQTPRWFCSMRCMDGRDAVIDATKDELAAMEEGGVLGGEYLDSIGKSDLGKLTEDEWRTFLRCVVSGYIEEMQRRVAPAQ